MNTDETRGSCHAASLRQQDFNYDLSFTGTYKDARETIHVMHPPGHPGRGERGRGTTSNPASGPPIRTVLVCVILLASASLVASPVSAEDPEIEIDHSGDELVLDAAPNQTIEGSTALENGTELIVRIRSSGVNPFIKSQGTTVGPEGRFAVSFDLSEHDDSPIQVDVMEKNGSAEAQASGRIGEPQTSTAAELDMNPDPQLENGETAMFPVTIPEGSDAVLRIGSETNEYRTVVRLEDTNEDGEVVLVFDATAAGNPEPTLSVQDGDRFEVLDPEPVLNGSLPSGEYELALAADYEGDPVVLGTLTVNGGPSTTTQSVERSGDEGGVIPALSDPFWRTTAPGIAGLLAILSGLASLVISRLYP